MQMCLLNATEAEKVERGGIVPDCHLHRHISKRDAKQLIDAGQVKSVNARAVATVGPPSSSATEYWYDRAVRTDDRYFGIARAEPGRGFRAFQLLNYMPRVKKTMRPKR